MASKTDRETSSVNFRTLFCGLLKIHLRISNRTLVTEKSAGKMSKSIRLPSAGLMVCLFRHLKDFPNVCRVDDRKVHTDSHG